MSDPTDDDREPLEFHEASGGCAPLGHLDDIDREMLHLVKANELPTSSNFHTLYSVQIVPVTYPSDGYSALVCYLRLQEQDAQIPLLLEPAQAEFLAAELLKVVQLLRDQPESD